MANPVLILTRNNLEMTKRCVKSVQRQNIRRELDIVDNGSTDGTVDWIWHNDKIRNSWISSDNKGVSRGWNMALNAIFLLDEYCLVLNNDTEIPPYFYSKLLSYNLPFVTGISVGETKDHPGSWTQPVESPDFSAFLIRKDCWERVGPFDESMKHYCSDCDFHIRAHRAGIRLMNAGVPFYHERSSTLRNASKEDKAEINAQANADRQTFRKKWGCYPWEPEYNDLFK